MLDETTPPDEGAATTVADITDNPAAPAATVHQPVEGDSDTTWLKLHDHIGVSANGNLEPLVDIGMVIAIPQMIEVNGKQELGETAQSLRITHAPTLDIFRPARFIEGGRIIETRDARVVEGLMQTGNWEQIDRPTKPAIKAHVKALTDSREEAANRTDEER